MSLVEASAAETRFRSKEKLTGEPFSGGAPRCTCQAALSIAGALLPARARLKASRCDRYSSVAFGITSK